MTSAVNDRRRNSRGTGSRLRDEIVQAAITLIDQTNDPAALTLRGIARVAGISAPSIYGHFADLESVTEAVLERSFQELTDRLREPAADPDPGVALTDLSWRYVQFGWEHRARYRLMFAASGYAPNAIDAFRILEGAIERCVEAGASDSDDPPHDSYLVWLALHGMATLEKPSRDDYLRLGRLDRPALMATSVQRLARLH